MKNVKKYIIVSAVLAAVIVLFAVLMIMYDKGVFDISFIKRETNTTQAQTDTEPATDTDPDSTDTAPVDSGEETDDSEETADQSVFDGLHEQIPSSNGKILTASEKTYDEKTMSIYRLDSLTLPENNFMNDYKFVKRYITARTGVLRTVTETRTFELRRAVDVYMGMLVVSDGKNLTFYNGSGAEIFKYTGEENLIFAYERDLEDRPLFLINEEYYYIDTVLKALVKSDYDNKKDDRGLYYNYPAAFGKDAVKADFRIYKPVAQKDEGGIGSVYFDGGYVMVRNIKYERDDEDDGRVVEDMEIIVDEDGREFPLPEGYAAKAYSDQRILVEYNGKYGFYAVKGAWIADSKYTYATPYYEGLAVVGNSGQKGVIDLDGNFVIPMSYSNISVCSGGIFVCWSAQTGYEVYIKTEN